MRVCCSIFSAYVLNVNLFDPQLVAEKRRRRRLGRHGNEGSAGTRFESLFSVPELFKCDTKCIDESNEEVGAKCIAV